MKHSFKAELQNTNQGMDTAFVAIPFDVEKIYGTKGQVKVKATFDGHPYRGVMANMGAGCHQIGVGKEIRKSIGKKVGDSIMVTIEKDLEERVVDVPAELQRLLSKNSKAKSIYEALSFTNRKEYALWISSAKKPETRKMRLSKIVKKLLSGMKNPSEK
jgi:Domain of unknown function (DUF1905)/Bacteriocin-protection, YdeI or OmpD-Associated